MTTQMGIRQLRDNLPAAIRRVRNGETIEVTNNGELAAVISPPPKTRSRLDELIALGLATAPAKSGFEMPRISAKPGIRTEQLIDEGRAERL